MSSRSSLPTYSLSNNSIISLIIPLQYMRLDVAHQFIMRAMSWHFPSRMDHLFGAPWWQQQQKLLKAVSQFADGLASYCDSQPPNCSFEVITRQVRAISSTMPETNGGGRARLMRSESRGRPSAECQGLLRGHLLWYSRDYLHLCAMTERSLGGY